MTRAKHNILIVDDEEAIRDSLGMVLEEEGFQTRTAKDGSEALEKARTHDYDLIILDYFMPKRSGLDILEQLKE
ncbi:MAG: response regulator, partial [Balneolaceae bacterium]|nr:response regulator [Balneolaceae bacterium]